MDIFDIKMKVIKFALGVQAMDEKTLLLHLEGLYMEGFADGAKVTREHFIRELSKAGGSAPA